MKAKEGNDLIDEFAPEVAAKFNRFKGGCRYDLYWDFLMPVVEKIEALGFDSRIHGYNSDGGFLCDFVDIENNEAACVTNYSVKKIEVVWQAVIQFIQWYNKTK